MTSKDRRDGCGFMEKDTQSKQKETRKNRPFRQTFTCKILLGIVGIWIFFQCLIMSVYLLFPEYDQLINRFSLSDAQSLGIAAAALAIWGLYRQEKYMWEKFGIQMGTENQPNTDGEAEELQIEKIAEILIPLQRVLLAVEDKMKEKDIKTDDVIQLIENLFKYEKEIKRWTERMEKLMPIFDSLAGTIENVDEKELGRLIGRKLGEYIKSENAQSAILDKEVKK